MRSISSLYFLFWLLVLSVRTEAQAVKHITLINPANIERPDELVVLPRTRLEKLVGSIPKYIKLKAGRYLAVQHDDLNGDGKWDEAVFLYSFQPGEKLRLAVQLSDTMNLTPATTRAHVRLRKKHADGSWGPGIQAEEMPLRNPATDFSKQALPLYLTEGPAWENDKVGFRLYFDVRNNKDIWGKRTARMVLDSVGTIEKPSYHDLHEWGMDIFRVGNSLGAGALALSVPVDNNNDTLIRLGGQNLKRTVYRQLADGPFRSVFQMQYLWDVNAKPVEVTEQISIWGGQYFYESKVWVKGAPQGTKLVAGFANFYSAVFRAFQSGQVSVMMSHGRQSENQDNLGLAMLVPSKQLSFFGSAPAVGSDILNTYLAAQAISRKEPCVFRFYAAWEKTNEQFREQKSFGRFLDREVAKLNAPILIHW